MIAEMWWLELALHLAKKCWEVASPIVLDLREVTVGVGWGVELQWQEVSGGQKGELLFPWPA